MERKIRPLTLEIDKDTWDKFKVKTPRSKTLNKAVVDLISREIGK